VRRIAGLRAMSRTLKPGEGCAEEHLKGGEPERCQLPVSQCLHRHRGGGIAATPQVPVLNGGLDGTRTRDLWIDRSVLSFIFSIP
jgi:hypothetical protein